MSDPEKSGTPATGAKTELAFEEALRKLESIVESMESDELPLEQLLARFEEGSQLAQICQAKLAEAEVKIQQLEKSASGQVTLKSFAVTEADEEQV